MSKYTTDEKFITGKRGQKIAIKAYYPSDKDSKYPAVIFSHGFGSNYRALEHHGKTIAEHNIICFFLDFCGGGLESLSDGSMKDMTILSEVSDLEDVYSYVCSLDEVDTEKIFLMGESQGGLVSAYLAPQISAKIRGLILWYPAFVIPDDSARRIREGVNEVFGLMLSPEYDKVAANIDIRKIMHDYSGPVLIIHGDKDGIVPIRYSESAETIYDNASLIVIKDADHGFDDNDSLCAINSSIDFMLKNIKDLN